MALTIGLPVNYCTVGGRNTQISAAVITHVHDREKGVVDLTVFPTGAAPTFREEVQRGGSAGEWRDIVDEKDKPIF